MRARETKYKGIQFRSRLEARWAVFFDELGLSWDYEPEGYRFDNGMCYLPDFYVHGIKGHIGKEPHGDGIFIEVKGEVFNSDKEKIDGFQYPILMVGEIPKSTSPWIDVDAQYSAHPKYVFSEYSVDGTEEALWFAVKEGQVYLIRYGESRTDSAFDLCSRACREALNKKFEYQRSASSDDSRGGIFDRMFEGLGDFGFPFGGMRDETPEQFKQRLEVEEKKKQEQAERNKEMEQILKDSVPKIAVEEWIACFKSMPGIAEYDLTNRLVNTCKETEIPLESMFHCTYDRDQGRLVVTYSFSKHEMAGWMNTVVYKVEGELVSVILEGNDAHEKAKAFDWIMHPVCGAIDWIYKEMRSRVSPDANVREKLNQAEQTAREQIKASIERANAEKAEEAAIIAENNPYRVGDFLTIMREEAVKPENLFKLTDVLSKVQLCNGVTEDSHFGFGSFMVGKRGTNIILQMNHHYSARGASGKNYHLGDAREMFIFVSDDPSMNTYFEVSRLKDIAVTRIRK